MYIDMNENLRPYQHKYENFQPYLDMDNIDFMARLPEHLATTYEKFDQYLQFT